jgi:hypothetical protein
MTIPADIALLPILLKVCLLLALLATGTRLLWQARRARMPATVVNGRVVAKGLTRIAPLVVVPPPPRLGTGSELGRLADVMQTARNRIDTITTCQRTAARHLDSAEVALNRLLADISSIMPPTITPSVQPRRSMALAA